MVLRGDRIAAVVSLLMCGAASAGDLPALPEPLALEEAIAQARPDLPSLELATADHERDLAVLAGARAVSGTRLSAIGRLRAIDPADLATDRRNNDSSARLSLRKRLYDFGYSEALRKSAREAGAGSEWRLRQARQEARLAIMRSFFDVILSDLQFARDNEAMAGAFISADRARDRHELKKLSDVALLRFESEYQLALLARTESEAQQRAARSRLAIAMGRPDDLVSEVLRPDAPDTQGERPDHDTLLARVLAGNPELAALRAEVAAAKAAVKVARSKHGPVLSGEVDAAVYNRETSSRHPLSAGLVLEIPLLTGGSRDAAVATARAELRRSRAALIAHEHALRQRVLDLWQRLGNLKTKLTGLQIRGDYRELYLDRSRALYELEVKTDLGDAMTETSAVRLDVAEAEFDWMMVEAQLAALAGRLLLEENNQ